MMGTKFGEEFEELWPVRLPEFTEFGRELLGDCRNIQKPQPLTLEEINQNSENFPVTFPIYSCKVVHQPRDRWGVIQQQAASAYPVVHERVVWLMLRFLEHKVHHGSRIEKEVYTGMSLPELAQRLITKRCLEFLGKADHYRLVTGEEGKNNHDTIGTDAEKPPLILRNCISYDEIKLAAFLSISSHSEFINDGNRKNYGVVEKDKSKIELDGVVIGLIGPKCERVNVMDYQDFLIGPEQNVTENGYGPENLDESTANKFDYRQMWNSFYDEKGFLFSDVTKDNQRFGNSYFEDEIADNVVLKKRYTISFETLLFESEARAAASGKRAYVHVVGIGLGVWRVADQQEEVFLLAFGERLQVLLPKLKHVSFVHFSWFDLNNVGCLKDGGFLKCDDHPDGGIRIFISKRNPAEKLKGPEFENCLIIDSYAWDSNAFPGNEFWHYSLAGSSDPAAACSTLITELHNGYINKTMVSGENLHVASPEFGVVHIAEYAKMKLD